MSIRRRLFLSNMLMLVIPVAVSMLTAYTILFVFSGGSEKPMERAFPVAFRMISDFRSGGEEGVLLEEVRGFNSQFRDDGVRMVVAKGSEVIYPQQAEDYLAGSETLLPAVLAEGVTGTMSVNNLRLMVERSGDYNIILVDRGYRVGSAGMGHPMVSQVAFTLLVLLGMILITNRILTRILTRSVTVPLGLLTDGVHQLRDGNLTYRIAYTKKDEFEPVCDDFNEMAEHLQRLIDRQLKDEQSRKELLAGISHDLRTPLTSIKAYVEGLLDGVAGDTKTQLRYLRTIRGKAEDIDNLVDKLFLFSKLEMEEFPFSFQTRNAAELLDETVFSAAEEYRAKGLILKRGEISPTARIRTDSDQLHRALVNILENSALYKVKEEGTLLVECRPHGDRIAIVLADDGPGVEAESVDKLFDVFYRGDPSRQSPGKGSGLGLAITRRLVERMGGEIRAENGADGGLRVTFLMPAGEDEAEKEDS